MSKNILVIGGTRFFGKLLVQQLLAAGHRVTLATRGRAVDSFGDSVRRIRVDRQDEAAMLHAFARIDGYDIVYDQMCYSPLDAAISLKVFSGKAGRYVMSSTIEVYQHLQGILMRALREDDLDLANLKVEMLHPWRTPELAEQNYAAGKRQAEAVFYRQDALPVVCVRIAHVLAGPQDFTGRLAHYVLQVQQGLPLRYASANGRSSFIGAENIADFLCWVGSQAFVGAVNAACEGDLSAADLYRRVATVLRQPGLPLAVPEISAASELSPFDYPFPYAMDTRRANSLGYRFAQNTSYLDALILQHAAAQPDLAATPAE